MTDPTRDEVLLRRLREPAFGTETTERNLMAEAADMIQALRERVQRWQSIAQTHLDQLQSALLEGREARAQATTAWEAGRDAAAEFACHWHKDEQPDLRDDIRALTPPADLSAALTARLDAELDRIIGEAKSIIEDQNWSGGGLSDAAMEQMMHRLDALRRAAHTEGEA